MSVSSKLSFPGFIENTVFLEIPGFNDKRIKPKIESAANVWQNSDFDKTDKFKPEWVGVLSKITVY